MITIQKLPSLEPEMRGALRKHIMRKRQRLKQEMEQDAIEKRLKKEREQKRLQDAMTLDQIKEQLSTLEKRLESLRSEKHDLFVQLKQVLNEGSSKRKQSDTTSTTPVSADLQKKAKIEEESDNGGPEASVQTPKPSIEVAAPTVAATTMTTPLAAPIVTVSKPVCEIGTSRSKPPSAIKSNDQAVDKSDKFAAPEQPRELNCQPDIQSPKQIPAVSPRSQANAPSFDSRVANHHFAANQMGHPMVMMGLPPTMNHNQISSSPYKFSDPPPTTTGFPRHDSLPPMPPTSSSMSARDIAAFQAQLKSSFPGAGEGLSSVPPELLMMSQRLNPNFQRLPLLGPHKLPPLNSLPMSMSSNLPPGLHDPIYSNVKLHGPNLNSLTAQQNEDLLPGLKKAHVTGLPPSPFVGHPNQFSLDNELPPHLAHLNFLNHSLPLSSLDPSTSIATPLPGLGPNMISNNFNPRAGSLPHQLTRAQLDYLTSRPGGPGGSPGGISGAGGAGQPLRLNLLMPGLNSIYPPHSSPSLQPPTSLYSGADFHHPLIQASLAQRMSNPMMPFNLAPQQQQHLQQSQLQQSQMEQANRMFVNNQANFHRRSSPKNQYYPNR